jgi:Kef-type K+ transport system membrane component KefB
LAVLWLILSAAALVLLLIFVVRPLFIFLAKKTKHYETPPQFVQLIILITLFLISWCGEIIGLTALIAAFAVGMLYIIVLFCLFEFCYLD